PPTPADAAMTIVPVIQLWTVQWNGNSPVVEKTSPERPAVSNVGVAQAPLSRVALCDSKPVFENVMTSPVSACTSDGWKAKSSIVTLTTGSSVELMQTD